VSALSRSVSKTLFYWSNVSALLKLAGKHQNKKIRCVD
jgi:hypothetical protein